jgi:ABC-type nitrate/sulfonate/bicarbonate transport system permease component
MIPSTMKLDVVSTGCCLPMIHIVFGYFAGSLPVDIVITLIAFFPILSQTFLIETKLHTDLSWRSPFIKW